LTQEAPVIPGLGIELGGPVIVGKFDRVDVMSAPDVVDGARSLQRSALG